MDENNFCRTKNRQCSEAMDENNFCQTKNRQTFIQQKSQRSKQEVSIIIAIAGIIMALLYPPNEKPSVPEQALLLATPTEPVSSCRTLDCGYPAIKGN